MKNIKNILIINTLPESHYYLPNLLDELEPRGYSFELLTAGRGNGLLSKFKEKKWPTKKIYLGPNIINLQNFLFFLFFTPINIFKIFLKLVYRKYKKKAQSIICLNSNEKIIIPLAAKILKIKIIWIENLNNTKPKNIYEKIIFYFYKIFSKWATIIVFSEKDELLLENSGIKKENISILNHGFRGEQNKFQENIFNGMTNAGKTKVKNNFFTLGTIVSLTEKQKIETILKAVKIALTVSPKIQLIIIGDGKERKNLNWIAKKMEIDSAIWFVGEQIQTTKWINNFDTFIIGNEKPSMADMKNILIAMNASLPIIGPENEGLEDALPEIEKEFFINMGDSEELAQKIIKIQQKKQLQKQLGRANLENLQNNLTINAQVEKFLKIV